MEELSSKDRKRLFKSRPKDWNGAETRHSVPIGSVVRLHEFGRFLANARVVAHTWADNGLATYTLEYQTVKRKWIYPGAAFNQFPGHFYWIDSVVKYENETQEKITEPMGQNSNPILEVDLEDSNNNDESYGELDIQEIDVSTQTADQVQNSNQVDSN